MRNRRSSKLCCLSAIGIAVAALAVFAQEVPDLRVEVALVNVGFSVRNADGAFIRNLTQNDFEVYENGVPQKIQFFGTRDDLPLTLGLLEDFSPSQDHFNRQHRRDTQAFLEQTMRPGDRAFLACFGDDVRIVADLTGDIDGIVPLMHEYDRHPNRFPLLGPDEMRYGGTALFDAIFFAAHWKMKGVRGRKALLVFSDGEDNASQRHVGTVIEAAQSVDAPIYAIRYTERKQNLTPRNRAGIAVMKRLGLETGGSDFDAGEMKMSDVFGQIGEELRSFYELAYTPTDASHDNTFRKIEIRAKQPYLTVRARNGYTAR